MNALPLSILMVCVLLVGCQSSRGLTTVDAALPTPLQFLGGWVLEDDECASDAGIIYKADGTFVTHEVEGLWSVVGTKLMTTALKVDNPDDNLAPRPARPESRYISTVRFLSQDLMRSIDADGAVQTFKRCFSGERR